MRRAIQGAQLWSTYVKFGKYWVLNEKIVGMTIINSGGSWCYSFPISESLVVMFGISKD